MIDSSGYQVRINIECAFGKLVHRWGILRRAIPSTIGIQKTTALLVILCRLHNFCIDRRLIAGSDGSLYPYPSPLAMDNADIITHGGISMDFEAEGLNDFSPEELLHGGEHFDDVTRDQVRQMQRAGCEFSADALPRDILHDSVIMQGLTRPTPT